jgi:hypothetical protein
MILLFYENQIGEHEEMRCGKASERERERMKGEKCVFD